MKMIAAATGTLLILVLAACGQSSSSSAGTASSSAPSSEAASASDGAKIFDTNCSSCHGASGQGIPGAIPPLADNPVATGDAAKAIHIVKYGLTGTIAVAGKTFNGQMPAWSGTLTNGDIAAVLTYLRSSWQNKAGAISEAQVAAVGK
jgi:mono/diheme cytochrome c family protein